jgi:aconitate decarboxylase
VTLLEGNAFVDQYIDDKPRDPIILDLANRVEVVVAPDLDALGPHEMRAVRVTVSTKSGQKFTESQTYRSGRWKNPLSDDALRAKFRDLAGRTLTDDAVGEVEGIMMRWRPVNSRHSRLPVAYVPQTCRLSRPWPKAAWKVTRW